MGQWPGRKEMTPTHKATTGSVLEAPDGAEFSITWFVTSESTGLDMEIKVGGLPIMPTFDKAPDLKKMLEEMGAASVYAPDLRLMTRDEIRAYKAAQKDDEE